MAQLALGDDLTAFCHQHKTYLLDDGLAGMKGIGTGSADTDVTSGTTGDVIVPASAENAVWAAISSYRICIRGTQDELTFRGPGTRPTGWTDEDVSQVQGRTFWWFQGIGVNRHAFTGEVGSGDGVAGRDCHHQADQDQ
jgi:hypothetical protein